MTRWLNHCKAQKSEVGCNQDSGSDSGFWVSLTSVLPQPQPGVNEHCITSNGRKLASFYSGRVLASLLRRQKRPLMMPLTSPISPRDVGSSLWTETLLYACSGNINVPITPDQNIGQSPQIVVQMFHKVTDSLLRYSFALWNGTRFQGETVEDVGFCVVLVRTKHPVSMPTKEL